MLLLINLSIGRLYTSYKLWHQPLENNLQSKSYRTLLRSLKPGLKDNFGKMNWIDLLLMLKMSRQDKSYMKKCPRQSIGQLDR